MNGIPVSNELIHQIQRNRLRRADKSRLARQAQRCARDGASAG